MSRQNNGQWAERVKIFLSCALIEIKLELIVFNTNANQLRALLYLSLTNTCLWPIIIVECVSFFSELIAAN